MFGKASRTNNNETSRRQPLDEVDGPKCPVHPKGICPTYIRLVESNNKKGAKQHIDAWERLLSKPDKRAWEKERQVAVIAESITKDVSQKNALLMESGPLCLGDPYRDPSMVYRNTNGPMFKSGRIRSGQVGDGILFERCAPLAEGNPYENPGVDERVQRRENKKQEEKFERKPFRPGGGPRVTNMPKPAISGDIPFMSLGGVDRHTDKTQIRTILSNRRPRPVRAGEVPTGPRNILTNPSKQGSYGTYGTTLAAAGKIATIVGTGNVGSVERYMSDPYEAEMNQRKLARAAARKEADNDASARPAFFPSSHARRNFNQDRTVYQGMGEAGDPRFRRRPVSAQEQQAAEEEILAAEKDASTTHHRPFVRPQSAPGYYTAAAGGLMTKRERQREADAKRSARGALAERPSFRPSSGIRQGRDADLAPFPRHVPDPVPEMQRRRKGAGSTAETDDGGMARRWVPPAISKARPTPSIALSKRNVGGYRI